MKSTFWNIIQKGKIKLVKRNTREKDSRSETENNLVRRSWPPNLIFVKEHCFLVLRRNFDMQAWFSWILIIILQKQPYNCVMHVCIPRVTLSVGLCLAHLWLYPHCLACSRFSVNIFRMNTCSIRYIFLIRGLICFFSYFCSVSFVSFCQGTIPLMRSNCPDDRWC